MLRILLCVITGYVVWSIVWVGMDALLAALSPGWFGKNFNDFQNAVNSKSVFTTPVSVCFALLLLGIFCSLVSGFAAVLIAKENQKTTLALGVLLLATGILVEIAHWNYLPVWYHVLFLLSLIPTTIAGGKLKRVQP